MKNSEEYLKLYFLNCTICSGSRRFVFEGICTLKYLRLPYCLLYYKFNLTLFYTSQYYLYILARSSRAKYCWLVGMIVSSISSDLGFFAGRFPPTSSLPFILWRPIIYVSRVVLICVTCFYVNICLLNI